VAKNDIACGFGDGGGEYVRIHGHDCMESGGIFSARLI
jgi:hypothetical protein